MRNQTPATADLSRFAIGFEPRDWQKRCREEYALAGIGAFT